MEEATPAPDPIKEKGRDTCGGGPCGKDHNGRQQLMASKACKNAWRCGANVIGAYQKAVSMRKMDNTAKNV